MFSLKGERVMNLAIMEQAAPSLQPCGFVSNLQTLVWFPVFFFFFSQLLPRDRPQFQGHSGTD